MMHHAALLCLAVPVFPLTLGIAATAAESPGVPWQAETATHRQVIALRTPVPRRDAVAAFEFSGVGASYANLRHGDTRNVGVIGLAVFTERGAIRGPGCRANCGSARVPARSSSEEHKTELKSPNTTSH